MNRTLLIFYDLAAPGQNREALVKKIKLLSEKWARLGNGAYLVVSKAGPKAIRDDLAKVLTPSDRLFVGVAPPPSAWKGLPETVSKWILENQE